ncbi:hypothetical protein EJB05_36228 [Eragrostis curvula]|uniref:Uncharacterized protein n=1 Tax=Eragrostis curvula TaxID=38414 RepID=A0A5J9UA21_9POAL|nr:hypothetical protein EJB05_36228 [Eragrostis curvula]
MQLSATLVDTYDIVSPLVCCAGNRGSTSQQGEEEIMEHSAHPNMVKRMVSLSTTNDCNVFHVRIVFFCCN